MDNPEDTASIAAIIALAVAASALCLLLFLGGTIALVAIGLLVIVGFLFGFLNL